MTLPLQVSDAPDLWKLLTQTTQQDTPDNPSEQLSDYVPAPTNGSDSVAVTDSLTFPNAGHSSTYLWGNRVSMWNKAEWS